jgi:hypothetical protein
MCSKNDLRSTSQVIAQGLRSAWIQRMSRRARISWTSRFGTTCNAMMIHYRRSSGLAGASIQTAYKATRAMTPLSESSIVSTISRQVSCALADETLILQLETGNYFRLNQVGTATWEFMRESHTVREIYLEILARYEVDAQRWERDLYGLLEEMREAELIEIKL